LIGKAPGLAFLYPLSTTAIYSVFIINVVYRWTNAAAEIFANFTRFAVRFLYRSADQLIPLIRNFYARLLK
jgi:hypothetical protein